MDVIQSIVDGLAHAINVLRTQTPGGFGLLIIPLSILGAISLAVARRR
jgi:hypothetical protein